MTNERSRHNGGLEAFAILAVAITFLLRYTPFLASHLLFGPFLDNVDVYGPIFSEVSRLTTFAYLYSTLSRDSRQAAHPADRHAAWQQGAMATTIDVIRKKMDTHPFAKRVPVQFIKGNFKERHVT